MILLPCPWCGPRDAEEFSYVGETKTRPDPLTVSAGQWRDYLYLRRNVAGWTTERWFHQTGCRRYLVVERDTTTNAVRSPGPAPEEGAP